MILNKYSLKGQMHLHFKFEILYIKFEEYFKKCAFFKKLVLKLKNIIYHLHTHCVVYFLRYRTCFFRKLTNFSKKKSKGFALLKRKILQISNWKIHLSNKN